MSTPDVRVRLSAEGTAEVVAALKKVQVEAEKSGKTGSAGFSSVNRALQGTSNLLGTLGIALSVSAFVGWIKSSADMADQLGKLSEKVGASTVNLSALQLVARTSDVDFESMGMALGRLNKLIAEAAAGTPQAVATLQDLRLSAESFAGKDSVEGLELVSKALAGIDNSAQKTKLAMDIFGRSGQNLIPLMNQLAETGLAGVVKRARELGVVIDDDVAAASQKMNDDFSVMQLQAQTLGAMFAGGLAPSISQSLQIVSGNLGDSGTAWKEFGQSLGNVLKFVVAIVASAFDAVGTIIAAGLIAVTGAVRSVNALLHGDFRRARDEFTTMVRSIDTDLRTMGKRVGSRFEIAVTTPPTAKTKPNSTGGAAETSEALLSKRAQAMRAALERELTLVRAQAALKEAAEKREYEQGLTDVRAYYAARKAAVEDDLKAQLDVIAKGRALLKKERDPEKREDEADKFRVQASQARLTAEGKIAELTAQEREDVRSLGRERLALDAKILESQGKRLEAARLARQTELQDAERMLAKEGAPAEEQQAELDRLRRSLGAQADFDEAKRQADAAMTEFGRAREEIQARADAGLMSQLASETQLLEVERDRVDSLREVAAQLEAAAQATGDPEKIAQAQAFADGLREVGLQIERSHAFLAQFNATLQDSTREALAHFFDEGISEAQTFGDAFRNMAASVIGALRQLAAEFLATAIARKIFGTGLTVASGGSGGGAGSGGYTGGGKPIGMARGGLVRGPGTATSDSIPAWLSRGEYIVPADVVAKIGTKGVEDFIRGMANLDVGPIPMRDLLGPEPGYADGGLVGGPSSNGSGGREGRLTIGLDDGLLLKALESPQGQRVLVKTIAKNRRAIRTGLHL